MIGTPHLPVAEAELRLCIERAALDAGRAIMEIFEGNMTVMVKDDASPVTLADRRAEAIICRALEAAYPGIAIIAEERASAGILPDDLGDIFFLVDPLDGTKEFVNRRSDFTVNIALIVAGYPACGVVFAPALRTLYYGGPSGAYRASVLADGTAFADTPVRIATCPPEGRPIAVASRSHRTPETDSFLLENGIEECVSIGSSLKFCLVAEGKAHIYPRFGRTMQWDTAAGDAVLRAAGGTTTQLDTTALPYGRRPADGRLDLANGFFICRHRVLESAGGL